MSGLIDSNNSRRALLKLLGGSAVLLPLAGLPGCARKEAAPAAAAPAASPPAAAPAPPSPPSPPSPPAPPTAPSPPAAAGSLPRLDENDPTAKALGYHQDSSKIDAAKYPRHAADQDCKRCVQFKGAPGDAYGGCNIFAGKLVNANGWCSAFAAKT